MAKTTIKKNLHPPVIKFKDERTAKRVHEHLVNEEDKISETDIRNVQTRIPPGNDLFKSPAVKKSKKNKGRDPIAGNKDTAPENEKIHDNTEPGIQTSWNILES